MGVRSKSYKLDIKREVQDAVLTKKFVIGLKTASFLYGSISLLAATLNFIFPFTEKKELILQFCLVLLLSSFIHFLISYFSSEKYYKAFLGALIVQIMLQGILMNKINMADIAYTMNIIPNGISGRLVDYAFFFPTVFLAISIALFRIKIFIFFIFLYAAVLTLNLSPQLLNEDVYFSVNKLEVFFDNNVINRTVFMRNIILFISVILVGIAILWQANRHAKSAADFEKNNIVLGRYFSPDIKNDIEETGLNFSEHTPKTLDAAVLFTDIVGFTELSEKIEPNDVLKLLSEYQTIMVECIFEFNGTVDKFIGDAVMASFGTPKSYGNDAQNAFDCAKKMKKMLHEWNLDRIGNKKEVIEHRIGIHFGECIVGNVGGEKRVEYTVLGDTVNVASRLCDLSKEFDNDLLISKTLYNKIMIVDEYEEFKSHAIKGRTEKIDLIRVFVT